MLYLLKCVMKIRTPAVIKCSIYGELDLNEMHCYK